ncbi:MAG: helix-turn-helix domain-containing protein [Acidimicrobiales bacterium]
MLVELGLVEQRYAAVLAVLNDGATVTDVARRNGVARQTVHVWLRDYAARGLAGLPAQRSPPRARFIVASIFPAVQSTVGPAQPSFPIVLDRHAVDEPLIVVAGQLLTQTGAALSD